LKVTVAIFSTAFALTKAHLGHLSLGGDLHLKEIAFAEGEHPGDDAGRKHLNLVVEEQDLVVIVLPGKSDPVLGAA
jgi:hypothetical protein